MDIDCEICEIEEGTSGELNWDGLIRKLWIIPIFLWLAFLAILVNIYDPNEKIAFWTLVVTLLGVNFAAGGLYLIVKQMKLQSAQERIEASFGVLRYMNTPEFHEIERASRNRKKGDEKMKVYAGYFEDLAIGIRRKYYDEDILFNSLEFIVPNAWEKISRVMRKVPGDKVYYREIENLAEDWLRRRLRAFVKSYVDSGSARIDGVRWNRK